MLSSFFMCTRSVSTLVRTSTTLLQEKMSQNLTTYIDSHSEFCAKCSLAKEFSPTFFPSFFLSSLSLGKQERTGAEGKITPKLKVRHPDKAGL